MENQPIKCPHCGQIFFDFDNKECPFCHKELTNYDWLNPFNDIFGEKNDF